MNTNKNNSTSLKSVFKKRSLCFSLTDKKARIWAFSFFIILTLIFPFSSAHAADFWDVGGHITESFIGAIISICIKFLSITFILPLFVSALVMAFMSLILGWVISPNFISLKFTQNIFVDTGLSITKSFANLGFVFFLIIIALATALRIEEYKAKKTIPTLIIIALLINFSPVFCGMIIDFSNVVMDFFLGAITSLDGMMKYLWQNGLAAYNLIIGSGFDAWATVAALMQVLVMIVFNFFAAFVFTMFISVFIMRYIMLWILVIMSPIAFVSYILPTTRRGGSLLSWRYWWGQLIAWSLIGIIAGFFLYLGFTMIAMINAAPGTFVSYPNLNWQGGEMGIMNNVIPYLIPLVLLWIAYREVKRTTALFATQIMDVPEKIGKKVASAAAMAAMTIATAGAGAVAGMAGKGMGAVGGKMQGFGAAHPGKIGGAIGDLGGATKKVGGFVEHPKDSIKGWAGRRNEGIEGSIEEVAEEHETLGKVGGKVKAGLKTVFLGKLPGKEGEEKKTFRSDQIETGWTKPEEKEEINKDQQESGWTEGRKLTQWEKDNKSKGIPITENNTLKTGQKDEDGNEIMYQKRELTPKEIEERKTADGEKLSPKEVKGKYTAVRKLSKEEVDGGNIKEKDLKEEELNDKGGTLHEGRKITDKELTDGYIYGGEQLSKKDIRRGYKVTAEKFGAPVIDIKFVESITKSVKKGIEDIVGDYLKQLGAAVSGETEEKRDKLKAALRKIQDGVTPDPEDLPRGKARDAIEGNKELDDIKNEVEKQLEEIDKQAQEGAEKSSDILKQIRARLKKRTIRRNPEDKKPTKEEKEKGVEKKDWHEKAKT